MKQRDSFYQLLPNGGIRIFDIAAHQQVRRVVTQWVPEQPGKLQVGGDIAGVRRALCAKIENVARQCPAGVAYGMSVNAEDAAKMYVVGLMNRMHLSSARFVEGNSVHLPMAQVTIGTVAPDIWLLPGREAALTLTILPCGKM